MALTSGVAMGILVTVSAFLLLGITQLSVASPAPLRFRGEASALVQSLYEKTSSTQVGWKG